MRWSLLTLAALLALGGAGCKRDDPSEPLRPVRTITVEPVATAMFGPFVGTVAPRYESKLGFQVSGRMVARDVYVGDLVKPGERLAALDPTLLRFAVARAEAGVTDAKAQVTNTQGIEDRQRTLEAGGNAPRATLDSAVAGRDTAKARLDQAEAALKQAQDQLGYTQLTAGEDGIVEMWMAEVGQSVETGQVVVSVARPDVREAVVDIPDDLLSNVQVGHGFTVHLLVDAAQQAQGTVREISPQADPATRTHRVRIMLTSPSEVFRLGSTVSVDAQRPVATYVLLPADLVLGEGASRYVWLISKDGTAVHRRDVTVSGRRGNRLVVTSGLVAGDKVVALGVHTLVDGQRVAAGTGSDMLIGPAGDSN